MDNIFEQGSFSSFHSSSIISQIRLNEARASIPEPSLFGTTTTVFISHKHDDLEDLKGILGFLEQTYKVKVYIDSQDPSMPKVTSAETAKNIKCRIKQCNKFILLATNGAVESKWCNWELGYGDADKYDKHIALFPFKPKGAPDSAYKGSEYMRIYPSICHCESTVNINGKRISSGYYVRYLENGTDQFISLGEWLANRRR